MNITIFMGFNVLKDEAYKKMQLMSSKSVTSLGTKPQDLVNEL